MSFIRRVRQVVKKMGRVDAQRLNEASERNRVNLAEHSAVHRPFGNMR